MTGYEAELSRIEARIGELVGANDGVGEGLSGSGARRTRLLCLRFQHAALRGDVDRLSALDTSIEQGIGLSPGHTDLWLLRASLALKLHRFGDAETFLHMDDALQRCGPGRLVQADVDLQCGRYDAARAGIGFALREERSWDGLARLAHMTYLMGDIDAADGLYAEAEDELTAKQMQSCAWIELQRGMMHLQRGRYARALAHYERANAAYPGYWMVEERMAEWMGAQGRFSEAIAAYAHLYAGSPRPEWEHALGDLYYLSGEPESALAWKTKALDHYSDSVMRGEVHCLHYLVDLCCELAGQGQAAVEWARRDEKLRSNFMTQGDLAWALYRLGRIQEALGWISKAVGSGVVSARLFLQAACIHAAVGDVELSAEYMRRSMATNPSPARARLPAKRSGLKGEVMFQEPARLAFVSSVL